MTSGDLEGGGEEGRKGKREGERLWVPGSGPALPTLACAVMSDRTLPF